jgi:pyruvate formate lyase activating enzyme
LTGKETEGLAFHPDYLMTDLPVTSLKDAKEARAAAKMSGLQKVHIGNIHVLC